jgi:repressor LexA
MKLNDKNLKIGTRQKKILEFIDSRIKLEGYPPSVREIAEAVGLSSSATVHSHLKKLEELGYIKRDASKPRAISLIYNDIDMHENTEKKHPVELVFVPIIGSVAAGKPTLAEENIEDYFPLTQDFVRGKHDIFMLNVHGDSMVNAGILDRDLVIVRKQSTAINGEIVVALLGDEATVKRFYKGDSEIKLIPENDYMEPILVKEIKILGKVIGIIRKYF